MAPTEAKPTNDVLEAKHTGQNEEVESSIVQCSCTERQQTLTFHCVLTISSKIAARGTAPTSTALQHFNHPVPFLSPLAQAHTCICTKTVYGEVSLAISATDKTKWPSNT